MNNYRPQLFLRTADITVSLNFPDGTPDAAEKMVSVIVPLATIGYQLYLQVMPGDNVEMVCDLVHDVAAEVGSR
jgi:elongation factor Tu